MSRPDPSPALHVVAHLGADADGLGYAVLLVACLVGVLVVATAARRPADEDEDDGYGGEYDDGYGGKYDDGHGGEPGAARGDT